MRWDAKKRGKILGPWWRRWGFWSWLDVLLPAREVLFFPICQLLIELHAEALVRLYGNHAYSEVSHRTSAISPYAEGASHTESKLAEWISAEEWMSAVDITVARKIGRPIYDVVWRNRREYRYVKLPRPFSYHVFISYTTREAEIAEITPTINQFCNSLRRAGFEVAPVFFDRLTIGSEPRNETELETILGAGIRKSCCMIAFVSPGYLESAWCIYEWRRMNSYILPIVWKTIDWKVSGQTIGLHRRHRSLRGIYPTFLHPHEIRLRAREDRYEALETYEHVMGWERAVLEACSFISNSCCAR